MKHDKFVANQCFLKNINVSFNAYMIFVEINHVFHVLHVNGNVMVSMTLL